MKKSSQRQVSISSYGGASVRNRELLSQAQKTELAELREERDFLHEFDRDHNTLIDYFVILSPDSDTLRKLIRELNQNDNFYSKAEYKRLATEMGIDDSFVDTNS